MTETFKEASYAMDISKLYMDDDQLKIHEQHQSRLDKARKETQIEIKKLNNTHEGL